MARKSREELVSRSGYYHVIIRGNNRKFIFREEAFKETFFQLMLEQEALGRFELAAWCIMGNHVHMILKADMDDLSEAIHHVSCVFAMKYNYETESTGHVYEGRYMSKPIDSKRYLLQSVRYVHNNPVKAMIVKRPELYSWSSYSVYMEEAGVLPREKMVYVMDFFGQDPKKFSEWHSLDDKEAHLDVKEDLNAFYLQRAKKVYDAYEAEFGPYDGSVGAWNDEIVNEMVGEILDCSHLSLRAISDALGLPYTRLKKVKAMRGAE